LVNQIFLPMISGTVRTSHTAAVRDFMRARRVFYAVALFAALGFLALGQPFTKFLLKPSYQMTGWMLQLLGLRVALDLFAAPTSSLMMACGETKYSAGANFVRLVLMVAGIWIGFVWFGMREAIVALIIAQAISYYPLIVGVKRLMPEIAGRELRSYSSFIAVLIVFVVLAFAGLR
jgi:O-antigen/teichoic acid export membrane protein